MKIETKCFQNSGSYVREQTQQPKKETQDP